MEREINRIQIRIKPGQFVAMCRCVKDDFDAYYGACLDEPYEDHSEDLDRMEEDLDLLEALLPYIGDKSTSDGIQLILADFRAKIAEVA